MANNPLAQHFRQPKIFIKLPSQGVYSKPGTIQGDVSSIPVYGMTGMDEIIMKTPDALLTGESNIRVIQSCCPSIKNAKELSVLDTDLIFTAIRIATFGNEMKVEKTCPHCRAVGEYVVDLNRLIEHFNGVKFNTDLVLDDIVIKMRPMTYEQSNDFGLRNFQLQQKLAQANRLEKEEDQQKALNDLFVELGAMQNELYSLSIESIQTDRINVTERAYIDEFLQNCDREIFARIKENFEKNRDELMLPTFNVECDECHESSDITVTMDQTTFFEVA
jgi:hypothetical protein